MILDGSTVASGAAVPTLIAYALVFGTLAAVEPAATLNRRQRWPTNLALTLGFVGISALQPVGVVLAASVAERSGFGLLPALALPAVLVWVAGWLWLSLASYVLHVLLHRIGWLWRIHRVHHTDDAVDVSTALRFHPLEAVVVVTWLGASAALAGVPPAVVVVFFAVEAIGNLASHAALRLPPGLERVVRLVLITPDLHRVHHAPDLPLTDRNYGTTLVWWDRLFGTLAVPAHPGPVGLTGTDPAAASNLVRQLISPFRTSR
jgi:sterol desaturase/sphingolipid hydroxylase (fatty acid hydroxylase superfamily)